MSADISPYIAWSCCLYNLLRDAERDGLLSIEGQLDPKACETTFHRHPLTLEQPYRDFAADLLSLPLGGLLDQEVLELYAERYTQSLSRQGVEFDEGLLRMITTTVVAWTTTDMSPSVACEFGRLEMPYETRPSANELFDLLRKDRRTQAAAE
ncbi:hypothetical protein CAI21_18240 [Alkalilimnicola ehrlichii]|uniref:Uncharacterized protein n=1 Tax=Alkalilimnicola ehrlichii TaxID=351052 RepID=A0A3E0WSH7_9GAMM|nr:hypothetical protein [Alkalilimnicola ehrlichii]RFA25797.1 hypothetical protein CAI21_18240 [Alkalilimnicola ehrlichii]RFA35101.1 hypothetical protein CAL65_13400 [Alkalilimnicola ehrlichii]